MKTKPTQDKKANPQLRWATKNKRSGKINYIFDRWATQADALSICVFDEKVVRVEIREVTK